MSTTEPTNESADRPLTSVDRSERNAWALPEWLERSTRWVGRLLVLAVGIVAALWFLSRMRVVFVPILVGLLLAALSAPLAGFMTKRGVPRIVSAWLTVLMVVGLLGGTVYVVGTSVGTELANQTAWDEVDDQVKSWLETGPADLTPTEIDQLQQDLEDAMVGGLQSRGISRATTVAEVVGGMFLAVILFFFFIKDGPSMWTWVVSRIKPRRRSTVDQGGKAAFGALQSYMRGVAITGLFDAVMIGLALYLIGVPLVIPLSVLTFFAAFFPIVGATLAGGFATLLALVVLGPREAIYVALATLVIQTVEGDVIMPIVMRRQVKLHPAVILVVLSIGGALAGIVGAFVAVPVAAMVAAAAAAVTSSQERTGAESETSTT